jgi:hypothetical protein
MSRHPPWWHHRSQPTHQQIRSKSYVKNVDTTIIILDFITVFNAICTLLVYTHVSKTLTVSLTGERVGMRPN